MNRIFLDVFGSVPVHTSQFHSLALGAFVTMANMTREAWNPDGGSRPLTLDHATLWTINPTPDGPSGTVVFDHWHPIRVQEAEKTAVFPGEKEPDHQIGI